MRKIMGKNHCDDIRKYLKQNILNNGALIGYEKERRQIYELLERTILYGESNSALLIGPRGCGKTTLVNDVLGKLEGNTSYISAAILVRLNGLVHTDDRLALKSATSQMNLENSVDGKVFGSFAENLAFLLACLKTGEKHTSKVVLFILEEFDLFCSHHNQTLLYNLFDISQSAQAPICVLGITCRLDIIELLEKRVKSRFSHRQFFLFPGQIEDGRKNISRLDYALDRMENYLKIPENSNIIGVSARKQWNSNLKSLLSNKKMRELVQRLVDIDLNEQTLKNIVIKCISQLKAEKLSVDLFQKEIDMMMKDDMIEVLQDLNVLELCLIIAMKHHNEIYDDQPMNFEMIFTRYIKFANANSNIQTIQRPVVIKAFEHIQNLELITMIHSNSMRVQKEYQFFKLMVTPKQILETVKKSHGLPTEVMQWANTSLV